MPWKKHGPGCPCCQCIPDWGYAPNASSLQVNPCLTPCFVINLAGAANIGLLTPPSPIKLIFDGSMNTCGDNGTFFADGQWAAVKTWVEAGGRLYLAGEFKSEYTGSSCIPDFARTRLNNFLFALGSTMSLSTGACNCGCSANGLPPFWLGDANPFVPIMTGLPGIYHACTAEVDPGAGGSILCWTTAEPASLDPKCQSYFGFIAIEKIGNGLIVLSGDSNITTNSCVYDNCEFWRRLKDWSTFDILGV